METILNECFYTNKMIRIMNSAKTDKKIGTEDFVSGDALGQFEIQEIVEIFVYLINLYNFNFISAWLEYSNY